MTGKSLISSTVMVEKLSYTEYSKSSICGTSSVFWLLLLQVDLVIQFSFKQIGPKHSIWSVLNVTALLSLGDKTYLSQ